MMSILFVSMMFGIPSGPGALYGLSERAHLLICSLEILGSGATSSGNPWKLGSGGGGGGSGGKNVRCFSTRWIPLGFPVHWDLHSVGMGSWSALHWREYH